MNRGGALTALALAALLLAGCASPWKRPGVSPAAEAADHWRCYSQALDKAPVRIVREQIEPGVWEPASKHCEEHHGDENCVYYPARYVPPVMGDVDVNQGPRKVLTADCMQALGYTR